MVEWTGEYRIYPKEEQKIFLKEQFGGVRFVYNYLLKLSNEIIKEEKRTPSVFELKRKISLLKAIKEHAWLKNVNSQSLQEAALNLEQGRIRYKKKLSGKPQFKKKYGKQRCTIPQNFLIKESKREKTF